MSLSKNRPQQKKTKIAFMNLNFAFMNMRQSGKRSNKLHITKLTMLVGPENGCSLLI